MCQAAQFDDVDYDYDDDDDDDDSDDDYDNGNDAERPTVGTIDLSHQL